jgi:hypothetical protein
MVNFIININNAIGIVLDLDEALVHTSTDINSLQESKILEDPNLIDIRSRCFVLDFFDEELDGTRSHNIMWGIKRPHLDKFLRECFEKYPYVIVWSAGTRDYVLRVADAIFPHKKPHFIFSREHCLRTPTDYVKPLKLLYVHEPKLAKLVLPERLIMIDDKENNFVYNKGNGLVIKKFDPDLSLPPLELIEELRKDDQYLLAAIKHLSQRAKLLNMYH